MIARRVVFYSPDRHILYDGRTPDKTGVGGGITARIRLATALARLGHDVTMVCNCSRPRRYKEVEYRPLDSERSVEADVLVLTTTGGGIDLSPALELDLDVDLRIVWIEGTTRPGALEEVSFDYLYACSNFIRDFVVKEWEVTQSNIVVVYNGIEEELFAEAERRSKRRDPLRLVYLGHPMKGLDAALKVHASLRQHDARYQLHLFGGPKLWGEDERDVPRAPGVKFHGLVGQKRLARELVASSFALHLQGYEEPFGISLAESLRAGCVVIASDVGAFPELVYSGNNGYLLGGDYMSPEVHDRAVNLVLKVTEDAKLSRELRMNACSFPWTWDRMARVWSGHWTRVLEAAHPGPSSAADAHDLKCSVCGGELLRLADGSHCLDCGRYFPIVRVGD